MALASSVLTGTITGGRCFHCLTPITKSKKSSLRAMASHSQAIPEVEIKGVVTRQLWWFTTRWIRGINHSATILPFRFTTRWIRGINHSATILPFSAERAGRISDLKLVQEELSSPSIGEVQVTIRAIGLNFADVFTCLGLYSATPQGRYTPGLEFAGIIRAVGDGVDSSLIGENVFGLTRFGAYTSHINVSYKYVRKFRDTWSFAEAASFPVQGLTMIYALRELGNVHKGQTVLLHSAAGGCGTFGLGICKKLNAKVIATVGHEHKVQYLVDHWEADFLPRERIIVRKGGGKIFQDQLKIALSSIGVEAIDCVIDAIQGDYFQGGYDMLSRGGRYIAYGASSFTPHGDRPNWISLAWKYFHRPMLDPLKMMEQNKSLMAFNLIWMFDKFELLERLIEELQSMDLKPPIVGHKFPFVKVHDALGTFQSGTTIGKVILEI